MDYIKLIAGIVLTATFTWILVRNSKRSGLMHSLFRVDTLLGMLAGLYLTFTAVISLWVALIH